MMRWLIAGLISLPFAFSAMAQDKHRQLGAHAHGEGKFNISIEGKKVSMELEVPGVDIVGFEHAATSKKQKAAVANAKNKLKDPAKVVAWPKAAGCKLQKASVELHIEGGDHDGHKHEEHKHGKKEAKEESHSEFHAEYELTCSSPEKIVSVSFPYFKNFGGSRQLEVTIVGPKAQTRFDVGRGAGTIDLRKMI